ncbi:hypothetical protein ACG04R_11760 [Roseateles sp. BYS78W]|uniref:ABC transporter permease n=1 Tax=Pelomonas candidula TaxID=3299025 RepID=A0ABW7HC11_9BURK
MRAALSASPDVAPPGVDLPLAARLLSGMTSAIGALLAVVHLEHQLRGAGALVGLLHVQATLLALVAFGLAVATNDRLSHWEARLAPRRSRERVRAELLRTLAVTAALGLAGPLLVAAVVSWQAGNLRPLVGVLAVLAAAFSASFCIASAWQGRAPRWLLLPGFASLLALLALPGAIALLCVDGGLALLVIALAAGMSWRCMLSRHALAGRAPPLPHPDLRLWWRRASAMGGWRAVHYQQPWKTMSGETRKSQAWVVLVVFMPQFLAQAQWLRLLAWGQPYTHEYAAPAYGLWMMCLAAFAFGGLIAPRLHWRRRLAPRSLTAQRWARSLVLGSMLAGAVVFSVGVGLAMGVNGLVSRSPHGDAWLPAMGDFLLAMSFGTWLRGRYERGGVGWVLIVAFGLAAAALLVGLPWLGVVPQRGAVWLLLQLALVLPLIRAAIQAWSRRDLNLMA